MNTQTKAVQNIINAIEARLAAACVSCPDVMMGCILDEAQGLVARGFAYDVALAKACGIYKATKHCATWAYSD